MWGGEETLVIFGVKKIMMLWNVLDFININRILHYGSGAQPRKIVLNIFLVTFGLIIILSFHMATCEPCFDILLPLFPKRNKVYSFVLCLFPHIMMIESFWNSLWIAHNIVKEQRNDLMKMTVAFYSYVSQ